MHNVTLAEYENGRDLIKTADAGIALNSETMSMWKDNEAGGSLEYLKRGLRGEVTDFLRAGEKLIDKFSNVAVEEYENTLTANMTHGALDYTAAMAGDPMCMYGMSVDRTDRSPVDLYIDPWVSGAVSAGAIQARGIATLALVQALSVYRPVYAYIVKGSHFKPKKADTIQTLQIPTQPMDLSKASFMLCSPALNRRGFLNAINAVHKSKTFCSSPPMSATSWQRDKLGGWMAERHGVESYLYLHKMDSSEGFWSSEAKTIEWLKAQLVKFVA
jgi:hypothetical protein